MASLVGSLLVLVCSALVMTEALDQSLFLSRISRSGDGSDITSLTGRTDVWKFIFETNTFSSYLFGNGYSQISPEGVYKHEVSGQTLNCAHNAYLTIFLGSGPIGFLLYIFFFIHSIQRVLNVRHYVSIEYLGFFPVTLCIFAVHSMTDSLFGIMITPAMCFILIAFTPPIVHKNLLATMQPLDSQDARSQESSVQMRKPRTRNPQSIKRPR